MKGRKPTPTSLKLVKGQPRPCRLNPDEPQPASPLGDPPADLTARAREIWKEAPYWLGDTDRRAWTRYCRTEADAEWFYAQCELEGWWIEGSAGSLVIHPSARLYKDACDRADRLAVEFGMTPSSRTRVKVPKRPPVNDPLAGRPGK